jgi:uncharacterized protein (TIGR03067 family)
MKTSFRRSVVTLSLFFALLQLGALPANAAELSTQQRADLAALQGTWIVSAAEQGGKPFDDIKGGRLTISSEEFALKTASGNELTGRIQVDPNPKPKQLDFLLSGGERWLAIYDVRGKVLRLNYVEAGEGGMRPTQFATSSELRGTVIALTRGQPAE